MLLYIACVKSGTSFPEFCLLVSIAEVHYSALEVFVLYLEENVALFCILDKNFAFSVN